MGSYSTGCNWHVSRTNTCPRTRLVQTRVSGSRVWTPSLTTRCVYLPSDWSQVVARTRWRWSGPQVRARRWPPCQDRASRRRYPPWSPWPRMWWGRRATRSTTGTTSSGRSSSSAASPCSPWSSPWWFNKSSHGAQSAPRPQLRQHRDLHTLIMRTRNKQTTLKWLKEDWRMIFSPFRQHSELVRTDVLFFYFSRFYSVAKKQKQKICYHVIWVVIS